MEIKLASEQDAENILELQKAAYVSEAELHNDFSIPPLTQTIDELKADFRNKAVIKITKNERIIATGQASIENGTCFISRLSVWPELQGKGIGSKVLTALEELFPKANRYELFTGEKSQANLAMYNRRGYKPFKSASLGNTTVIFLEKHADAHS